MPVLSYSGRHTIAMYDLYQQVQSMGTSYDTVDVLGAGSKLYKTIFRYQFLAIAYIVGIIRYQRIDGSKRINGHDSWERCAIFLLCTTQKPTHFSLPNDMQNPKSIKNHRR